MRILLTGATGLIGTRLSLRLFELGHDLVVLSRQPDQARNTLALPAEHYAWSPEREPPASALENIDAVIHLAGEPIASGRWNDSKKERIRNSRVAGTRNLVQAIAHHAARTGQEPRAFISTSAIGFYGDRGDESLTEASPAGMGFLPSVCEEWEAEALKLGHLIPHSRTRTVIFRIGIVLSPAGGALAELLPIFKSGLGGRIGSGRQWMSWIHIDDAIGAIAWAVDRAEAQGIHNLVAPKPVTNREFCETLASTLRKPCAFTVPPFALKIAKGEMGGLILESQRVTPERLLASGYSFEHPILSEALAGLLPVFHGDGAEEFQAHQWVPKNPNELFPFFSSEKNLEEITPPTLGFHVLGKSTDEIREGTLIDYRLRVHGVPMRWQTRIEEWSPNRSFVDVQLKGPYARWHHTHDFIPLRGGTLLKDRVIFKLPFGLPGTLVAGRFVRKDVHDIFNYRKEVIHRIFGGTE